MTEECRRQRAPLPGKPIYVWVPIRKPYHRPQREPSARNLEIIRLRHHHKLPLAMIAHRYGISPQRVFQIAGKDPGP